MVTIVLGVIGALLVYELLCANSTALRVLGWVITLVLCFVAMAAAGVFI